MDIINGLFEFAGGFFVWANCRKLYSDKCVRGVSPLATGFFVLWGFWNLAYYPSLAQFASFAGAINVVAANVVWLSMMWYYRDNGKKSLTQIDWDSEGSERNLGIGAADEGSLRESKI